MAEQRLQVFIEGVMHYFRHTSDKDVKVGTPYLVENDAPLSFDVTGIIGITGACQGCVYFTAPRIMLRHLLLSLGEPDTSADNMFDLVGEVANTISGNARREFGKDFMISVPLVLEGAPEQVRLPKDVRSFVIPVYWKAYSAAMVICLAGGGQEG